MAAVTVERTDSPTDALAAAGAHLATDPIRHNLVLTLLYNRAAALGARPLLDRAGGRPAGRARPPVSARLRGDGHPDGRGRHRRGGGRHRHGRRAAARCDRRGADGRPLRWAVDGADRYGGLAGPGPAHLRGRRGRGRAAPGRTPPGRDRGGPRARDAVVRGLRSRDRRPPQRPRTAGGPPARRRPPLALGARRAGGVRGRVHPVEGVARIGPVYTPPERRGRGYGSALVGSVSAAVPPGARAASSTPIWATPSRTRSTGGSATAPSPKGCATASISRRDPVAGRTTARRRRSRPARRGRAVVESRPTPPGPNAPR